MGHTRRIAKGGAPTPDIFQDPFMDKKPPPGHESFSAEDKKMIEELYTNFKKNSARYESMSSLFKRILKHFYARWKKIDPLPGPLDSSHITEDQRKEMENYIQSKKIANPNSSLEDLGKDFLYEIFETKDFSELKEKINTLESANEKLDNGLIANHQGGEPGRLIFIIFRPLQYIDLIDEVHTQSTLFNTFLQSKGITPETQDINYPLSYDSLIYSVIETHVDTQKEQKEHFSSSSKILLKEDTNISSIFLKPIIIPAVYLIEKEYMKEAWKENAISSFSKNIGYYMRQSGDGLEVWNQSKWISLGDMSSLETIYLWHERFLILDKTPFEYINLLDVESQEKETDEEKQRFFDETKKAIEGIVSSEEKRKALETIRTKLRRRQFLLKTYESIKDQTILLMDPETMAFLYIQTPSLWETTGFKRYTETIPEQNIKMIMLLQYVRILSDFQKKKQNKTSFVKQYQGIGLLKDSLQDKKIQDEVLEILDSGAAWNRVLEKQIGLYAGYENPIQTMDQLKAFLADIQKPLEMKAIDLNAEMANTLGSPAPAPVENEEGTNNESNAGTNISNVSIEVDESNPGSEISNLTNQKEESKEEESKEEENNESNAPPTAAAPPAPAAAAPNTSFLRVFQKTDYFDPKTQTFPNLEKDIITKYSYSKEEEEQIQKDPSPLEGDGIENVYSSGNNSDCLVHSFLTNISPAFRRLSQKDKNAYATQYRTQIFPSFYKNKEEDATNQNLLHIPSAYLNDTHIQKLREAYNLNILVIQSTRFTEGGKDVYSSVEYFSKNPNRPYIIIYNRGNYHFTGMRHTADPKGFLFSREEIDTLIKKYTPQLPSAENIIIQVSRPKDRVSEAIKAIDTLILEATKNGKNIPQQLQNAYREAEQSQMIVEKISGQVGEEKRNTTKDLQLLVDANLAANAAEVALKQAKSMITNLGKKEEQPKTNDSAWGGRRRSRPKKTTRKKNRT